jgi:hypothetical protein
VFERSFAHTGRVEQAKAELARLKMVGEAIDDYIAKFENFVRYSWISGYMSFRLCTQLMDEVESNAQFEISPQLEERQEAR